MTFISSVLIFFVHLIQSLTDVFLNNSDQLVWKFISDQGSLDTTGQAPWLTVREFSGGVRYLSFQKSISSRKSP